MDALLTLAADQHGLFTTAQWKGAGLSRRSLTYKAASGVVREIHPGVFAVAGAPSNFEQEVLAACLSVGGVASHRCAAYLWGFRKFESVGVEVLVRKDHTPSRSAVKVRRTGWLDDADIDKLRGLPITARARTLLDLLGRVGPQHPGSVRFRELVAPFAAGQRAPSLSWRTTSSSS